MPARSRGENNSYNYSSGLLTCLANTLYFTQWEDDNTSKGEITMATINELVGKTITFEYSEKIRLFEVEKVNEKAATLTGWQIEATGERNGRQFAFAKMQNMSVVK